MLSQPDSAARPWREALLWLALLAPFFFASYGFANSHAARAGAVGSIVFDWEHAIPFLPWTILPYWSIDLFYGASLLVCSSRRELRIHVARLFIAQLVSVVCFLVWPLRFSFVRPESEGVWGILFTALGSFDKPFNQAPSLHISLLVLLWSLYARHLAGAARRLFDVWFALIGVSVLTTFQHHFIDLPAGALLGCLIVWALPFDGRSPLRENGYRRHPRGGSIGLLWLAASMLCLAAGRALAPAGWFLLWPATSLAIVASAYLRLGPAALGKRADGRHEWPVRLLLAPYLVGTWINSRLWTRRLPRAVEIVPGVLLGRMPSREDAISLGLAGVVDLAPEMHNPLHPLPVHSIAALDLVALAPPALAQAVESIEAECRKGRVLVCCALGFSRSALAVAAWLVSRGETPRNALARVRAARPRVVLGDEHESALMRFAEALP